MKFNRQAIIHHLREQIQNELEQLAAIARQAREAATHGELKQEGKYDTRGIEAGYLAGAQARRVEELKADLASISRLEVLHFSSDQAIAIGALVELYDLEADHSQCYFIAPVSGGGKIQVAGAEVTLISHQSPIGRELIGLKVGETIEVQSPRGDQEYVIQAVF